MSAYNYMSNMEAVAGFSKRIQALKAMPAKQVISIDGVAYSAAQVIAIFEAYLKSQAALAVKQGELKLATAACRGAKTAAVALDPGLKRWTVAHYGAESQVANDLGYLPRKKAPSAETRFHAVQQARATRKARNTVGPKAKLRIVGIVADSTPAGEGK